DGLQTRDLVFVGDVARANVLASTAEIPRGESIDDTAINVATSRQVSVADLARTIGEVLDVEPVIEHAPARAGELMRSALDIGKAGRVLGWRPEVEFADALGEVANWIKESSR
ncbi:MAG: UDP-glucose 4-epimerase, partial [Gemmatimonadales bacterium]